MRLRFVTLVCLVLVPLLGCGSFTGNPAKPVGTGGGGEQTKNEVVAEANDESIAGARLLFDSSSGVGAPENPQIKPGEVFTTIEVASELGVAGQIVAISPSVKVSAVNMSPEQGAVLILEIPLPENPDLEGALIVYRAGFGEVRLGQLVLAGDQVSEGKALVPLTQGVGSYQIVKVKGGEAAGEDEDQASLELSPSAFLAHTVKRRYAVTGEAYVAVATNAEKVECRFPGQSQFAPCVLNGMGQLVLKDSVTGGQLTVRVPNGENEWLSEDISYHSFTNVACDHEVSGNISYPEFDTLRANHNSICFTHGARVHSGQASSVAMIAQGKENLTLIAPVGAFVVIENETPGGAFKSDARDLKLIGLTFRGRGTQVNGAGLEIDSRGGTAYISECKVWEFGAAFAPPGIQATNGARVEIRDTEVGPAEGSAIGSTYGIRIDGVAEIALHNNVVEGEVAALSIDFYNGDFHLSGGTYIGRSALYLDLREVSPPPGSSPQVTMLFEGAVFDTTRDAVRVHNGHPSTITFSDMTIRAIEKGLYFGQPGGGVVLSPTLHLRDSRFVQVGADTDYLAVDAAAADTIVLGTISGNRFCGAQGQEQSSAVRSHLVALQALMTVPTQSQVGGTCP